MKRQTEELAITSLGEYQFPRGCQLPLDGVFKNLLKSIKFLLPKNLMALKEDLIDCPDDGSLVIYYREVQKQAMREVLATDAVAQSCKYVSFLSESRGRSRGKNRSPSEKPIPRRQREVELLGYGGKFHTIREDGSGGLDDLATEILGGGVLPERTLEELIRRVRLLPQMERTSTGF